MSEATVGVSSWVSLSLTGCNAQYAGKYKGRCGHNRGRSCCVRLGVFIANGLSKSVRRGGDVPSKSTYSRELKGKTRRLRIPCNKDIWFLELSTKVDRTDVKGKKTLVSERERDGYAGVPLICKTQS